MINDKIQVSARISKELYDNCIRQFGNITNAISSGLELLCKQNENKTENNCNTNENNNVKQIEEKNTRIKELQEQIKVNDGHQQARIDDLKDQIQELHNQLRTKDTQIEKLNENIRGQVANIYNLTKGNNKLLPENNKKRWWEFWRN